MNRLWLRLMLAAVTAGFHQAAAQDFTQRGFLVTSGIFYPREAPNDSGLAVGESLFRYEAFWKAASHWQLTGAVDARFDTHHETQRDWHLSWWDRERQRPAFAVRRLSATYSSGKFTLEAGKQFVRWGRTDILTPTDRFAPRDYLNVVNNDFLSIMAARVTYGGQSNSIDVVYSPRLTPSRIPLLNQRWAVLPPGVTVHEVPPEFPGGPELGTRFNHIGSAAEFALTFFNGYDHQPLFRGDPSALQRFYPQMRMYGGDLAIPLSVVTLKAESGYFTSTNPLSDEYVLYVVQLERQTGEWFFVGGYTGQAVTRHGLTPGFSVERGFSRAFTAHAGYTIDTNRSVSLEAAVRQNGQGVWLQAQYSQAFGQHWRATAGFTWIHGDATDFLGRYYLNSYGLLELRYSF